MNTWWVSGERKKQNCEVFQKMECSQGAVYFTQGHY